jgi:hypothetical protein
MAAPRTQVFSIGGEALVPATADRPRDAFVTPLLTDM